MSELPQEITIDGARYRRIDHPDKISSHCMYDCHLFRPTKGATVEDVIEDWQREFDQPDEKYGQPMLCPIRLMDGDRVLREVGKMVFRPKDLEQWRAAAIADPDVARLLKERA